jgi:hypothetical protein
MPDPVSSFLRKPLNCPLLTFSESASSLVFSHRELDSEPYHQNGHSEFFIQFYQDDQMSFVKNIAQNVAQYISYNLTHNLYP